MEASKAPSSTNGVLWERKTSVKEHVPDPALVDERCALDQKKEIRRVASLLASASGTASGIGNVRRSRSRR